MKAEQEQQVVEKVYRNVPAESVAAMSRNFCNALPSEARQDLIWQSRCSVGYRDWIEFSDCESPSVDIDDRHGYPMRGRHPHDTQYAAWGSATSSATVEIFAVLDGETMTPEEAQDAVANNAGNSFGVNFHGVTGFDIIITQDLGEDERVSMYWDMARSAWVESDEVRSLHDQLIQFVGEAKDCGEFALANRAFRMILEIGPSAQSEIELEVGAKPYHDLLVVDGECIPVPMLGGESYDSEAYRWMRAAKRIPRREHGRDVEASDDVDALENKIEALEELYRRVVPPVIEHD